MQRQHIGVALGQDRPGGLGRVWPRLVDPEQDPALVVELAV